MNNKFVDEFLSNRDETFKNIKESEYSWNKFIIYWSKILDDYSVDNVLNLYSYNSNGRVFKTFDEWNSDTIERRIKPKSKGIPILKDNYKIYVFDIKQTYGKEYRIWNYNHYTDNSILKYYQNQNNIDNDNNKNIDENFYSVIFKHIKSNIEKEYTGIPENEVEFIAKTMTSLFLSKANFNIFSLPSSYENLDKMNEEDILKCLQISNKETATIFNDFINKVNEIESIQNYIQTNVLFNYKNEKNVSNKEKEEFINGIEDNSQFDYKTLESIYDSYLKKYENSFKKAREHKDILTYARFSTEDQTKNYVDPIAKIRVDGLVNEELSNQKKDNNIITSEQMSLFTPREEELASKICDIFNSFDTKYQNTFEVRNVELQRWDHINSKKRNLTILLKSPLADYGENAFSYFNKDKTDEIALNDGIKNNAFLQSLYKDKDFSIYISPDLIHIMWSNFDDKQFDLNIPSTKLVNQKVIDDETLEKIDEEVSDIVKDNDISYVVKTAEIIPTRDGIETNVIEEHSYNSNGEEIKEEYPPINYHISDDKVDTSFGAKSRFEDNIKAIELLKELESEDRNATKEEQDILSRYVGWGGIADAFDERKNNWKTERERLKLLLNEEEYKAAAHSTLSSFYTPNMAIDGIYKTLKKFGFEKGNILEPSCAIGNFFGRLPSAFDKSKLYGVELDSISGRIAKKLYPNAKIEITGYENSKVADELFDVAVGNVPFGNNTVYDKRYKDKFLIHDYFFQKTLDKVRDGGIIAFITTDGTLDKKDTRVREYIAKRAEFLGAIRLPNNTFTNNANAKVTSDIIFLKKRDELKQDISDEKWIYTSEYQDGMTINNYYIDNPNMMLGKMELQSTAYGYDNTLSPIDEDINVLMNQAIEHLPSNIYEQTNYIQNEENDYEVLDADDSIKNNAFTIINNDGKDIIYQRSFSSLVPYSIQDGMVAKRIIGLCKVKNALREVFDIQLRDGSDEELSLAQEKLSKEYDEFYKRYGYINDSVNARAFDSDPDYYLLTSIENKVSKDDEDENDKPKYEKGDVFTKRTIRKSKVITSAENAEDALKYSLNNRGCVDFEYMKTLYPKSEKK